MMANLGKLDRIARLLLGMALFFAPLLNLPPVWSDGVFAFASMAVGLVSAATAFFRFCPLYRVFGISTCKL